MLDRITEQPFCQTRVMCMAVDNLELLLSQPDESVDLIYCDVLYGTGRSFGDYKDLKPIRSEIEAHYLPRLKEMHRVLKPTGSIYLQMDWRINHWIRCLLDDIFGYEQFRNEIIWKRGKMKGAKAVGNQYGRNHDTIFFYSKNEKFTYNRQFIPYEEEYIRQRYTKNDGDGKGAYTDQPIGTRSKESIKSMREEGRIFKTSGGTERVKFYLSEMPGIAMDDVWLDIDEINSMSNDNYLYPTQKPKELISRFVLASTNEGDVVADYYLGSGTTCEVALELGRKFIGCDINPRAIEITKERIKRFL